MDVDLSLIETICRGYATRDICVLEDIPEKKLQNAVKYFPISSAKRTYVLYDSTVFKGCKHGIAVCDNGVVYKNDWMYDPPNYKHFKWEEFAKLNIYIKNDYIYFGDYCKTPIVTEQPREMLVDLFKKLQAAISIEKDNEIKNNCTWMLAIDGKQYGPMDEAEVNKGIAEGDINPNSTFLWKQGMNDWELPINIREFKKILNKFNSKDIPSLPPIVNREKAETKELISDKLDINNCKLEELLILNCIDLQKARLLLELRDKGKKFYVPEDIGSALDLKPHEVEEIRGIAVFNLPKVSRGIRRVEF
ncbi:DUF4339 domain-containing protein [Clostridium tagluense]|uniref:DUF4339 domain-containing protein n=1 Tax=Clostridium tagluense TaxID=360422 RepID=UPI001C0CE774|nr:DUF4339 domain-containing protein [Clostridium tagluense]MBU3130642.1 DUF4339 domain-containing protein [Clostridium tagluense]